MAVTKRNFFYITDVKCKLKFSSVHPSIVFFSFCDSSPMTLSMDNKLRMVAFLLTHPHVRERVGADFAGSGHVYEQAKKQCMSCSAKCSKRETQNIHKRMTK